MESLTRKNQNAPGTPTARNCGKRGLFHLLFALLIGALFLLPHLVRMETLHSIRGYSPFSARSSSPTTIDETFLYGAEVNYSYRQHRLAYDTDAFEHRNQPMPYSLLPTEAEVLLARCFSSVAAAQIFCCFLFPAIAAWLLMELFLELDASIPLAALLALLTLVMSFSARTLEIGMRDLLRHGLHSGFIETLQASRNPNPNMTFPLFLGALLALAAALRRRSGKFALLAGILGGLLFYSYIYYAIAWAAVVALLTLAVLLRDRASLRPSLVALATTIAMAVPFLLWVRAAKKSGGYIYRSDRLGMIRTHLPPAHDAKLSVALAVCLVLLWLAWRWLAAAQLSAANDRARFANIVALLFGCAAAGGILGMNMELLTGSDVQFEHHFPHMVIQPALILLAIVVLLSATALRQIRLPRPWPGLLFLFLFAACAATQVEAGVNSAPLHRVVPWEHTLFHWLNHNTQPGDVVATTSLELAVYMPLYSQDYSLMVDGSRTSASDQEIIDRYLLAEALTGAPASTIASDLGIGARPGRASAPWKSYPAFFFEHSADLANPSALKPAVIQAALSKYRSMNVAEEVKRFRVDYLYTEDGQKPADIAGATWRKELTTSDGALWRLVRQ